MYDINISPIILNLALLLKKSNVKKTLLVILTLFSGFFVFSQNDSSFKAYDQPIPGSAVKFTMTPIPAGHFLMGSPAGEKGRKADEGPQQTVSLDAFWMGVREVTYDEFLLFFNDEQTSRNSDVDAITRPTPQYIDLSWGMGKQGGFPVNSMSQHTALMYCRWLYKKTGIFYRLPTEAEWEYACRAGSNTAYFFGNDAAALPQYAWFEANSKDKYHKTGQKKPNAWGLYDMIGNVSEWTLDQYNEKYFTTIGPNAVNPYIAPANVYPKSIRGGGYTDKPADLRSASRSQSDPSWNKRDPQIPKSKWWLTDAAAVGFRIVRPLHAPSAAEADSFYNKYLNLGNNQE